MLQQRLDVPAAERALRVCHVVPYLDRVGGYERQALALATHQRTRLGLDTTLLTHAALGRPDLEPGPAGPVHRIPRGLRLHHPGAWWRRHGRSFDVIHAHALHRLSALVVACAARDGIPALVKVASADDVEMYADPRGWAARHPDAGRKFGWLRRRVLRHAFRNLRGAAAFVALNDEIAAQLTRAGIPAARVVRIPNGVDVERITPATPELRGEARRRLGLPEAGAVLAVVGRLVPGKDVPCVLRALALLRPEARPWLVVAGDGPQRRPLEEAAAALGIADRVRLLGEVEDVAGVLAATDLFVSASRSEGMSNAVLEAWAAGLVTLLSQVPGHVDAARTGAHVMTFAAGDASALASALAPLLADPARRQHLGRAARSVACERHALSRVAARYAALYAELAECRPRFGEAASATPPAT